jgi:hypothetical protein
MAHFYGFSDHDMESMLGETFQDYWLAVEPIEAGNSLRSINISVYKSLKKQDRDRMFNELNKKTQSIIIESNRAELSVEDAAKKIAMALGNG